MRYKLFLLLGLLAFCEQSAVAQLKYDFPQFGRESAQFFTQPGKWQGSDYLKLGILTAGSFFIMETSDSTIRRIVLADKKSYYTSIPIEWGRMWGEVYMPVVVFGIFAAHSLIFNDMATRKIGYEVGQAALYAGAINYIMKVAFGRARPYTNETTTSFHPFELFGEDHHSFPSGHTTAAMVLSTILSRNVKSPWLKVLAYLPAPFTIISRQYQDQHWLSDAIFGGVAGYFIAKWVVDTHEEKEAAATPGSGSSMPIYPINFSIIIN